MTTRAWTGAACLLLASCTRSYTLEPPDASVVPPSDAGARDARATDGAAPCVEPTALDLLIVVDNSNSMAEEQLSLSMRLPSLVHYFVTGDRNGDGVEDVTPLRDIHIGVVSPDLGGLGFPVPTCDLLAGDDGLLLTRSVAPGCEAMRPAFLSWGPGVDQAMLAAEAACAVRLGTGGCGFEQPLEAALKALTPSASSITFARGTRGHGDLENAGFLRSDSLLAIVIVTDEEDCSVADPELLNPTSLIYTGDLNLRCFQYPTALHPVARYVDGFRALRASRPDLLFFAVVAGVPPDLVTGTGAPDYDAILADPRMQERVDPMAMTTLVPSCNVPGRGIAFPPRRMVELARAFAGQSTVASLCQEDYGPIADELAVRVSDLACPAR